MISLDGMMVPLHGKMVPLLDKTIFRLANDGKVTRKVQAWTNPAYDTTSKPGDAAITVQPAADDDLIEMMFPSSRSMLRRMVIEFWAVVFLVVTHAMVTAYTDPIYTRSPLTTVIVYSAQVGLLVAIIMAFFLLTSQLLYIQLGRYDLYLREFAAIYLFFLVELGLYLALKVYSTVLLYRRVPYLDMWYITGYMPLWAVQRAVLVLFWAAAVYSALAVFDVRYFDPELLLGLEEKANDQQRGAPRAAGVGR